MVILRRSWVHDVGDRSYRGGRRIYYLDDELFYDSHINIRGGRTVIMLNKEEISYSSWISRLIKCCCIKKSYPLSILDNSKGRSTTENYTTC